MDHGFVLHHPLGQWESTLRVQEQLGLTTSRDILSAIAAGDGPEKSLVTLGYAGWGPGQLEQEISNNAWLTVPNDIKIVFDVPANKRWQAAASKLGIDLNLLAGDAGHA
jgi:putative transcriptional regulator